MTIFKTTLTALACLAMASAHAQFQERNFRVSNGVSKEHPMGTGLAKMGACTLEKSGGGFAIPAVHLALTARIPGASQQAFETAAENAKTGCPVSKLLNATITLDKKLEA